LSRKSRQRKDKARSAEARALCYTAKAQRDASDVYERYASSAMRCAFYAYAARVAFVAQQRRVLSRCLPFFLLSLLFILSRCPRLRHRSIIIYVSSLR